MAQNEAATFWKAAHLRDKWIIIIGIIYVLSPLDIIPEVVLGPLGLLDDGGAIFVVLLTLWRILKRVQDQKGIIEGEEVARPDDK
ncbi:DUF1232 domain-containing protein [Candidatus Saccharibacteria bacterium]|nr:MAG: DUF1232 domain-containing protein [Candidatus Saccharibacteria bacterium]